MKRNRAHNVNPVFGTFMFLILFYSVGASVGDPIISRFAESLAGDPLLVGVLISFSWITYTILAEPAGSMISKIDERRAVFFGGLLDALGFFIVFLSSDIFAFGLAMVVEGIGSIFFWAAARTHTARVGKGKTGKSFGLYTVAWSIGWAIGPIMGGTLALLFDIRMPFLLSSAILLCTVVIFTKTMKPDKRKRSMVKAIRYEAHGGFLREGLQFLKSSERGVKRILLLHILKSIATTIIIVFIPLYFIEINYAEIGYVLFFHSLVFAFSSLLWGSLGDRIGKGLFLIMGFAVSGSVTLFLLNTLNFVLLFSLLAVMGLTFALIEVPMIAMLNDRVSEKEKGIANGVSIAAFGIGSSAGPIIGGFLAASFGFASSFIFASVIYFIAGGVSVSLRK